MASRSVVDAVNAKLTAQWTLCPVVGVNGVTETPLDGSTFVMVQYPVGSESHVGMAGVGNRTFREEGVIRFVVHYPRGQGVEGALDMVDGLRNLFRAQQFGGVTTYSPSPGVVNDDNDLGNYFVVSTSMEYFIDILA